MRLIVGMSGATGAIYGIRLLQVLKHQGVEAHLVMSTSTEKNVELETSYSVSEVKALVTHVYDFHDIGATISSGSFVTDGMVVIPCSIKSLAGVANRCRPFGKKESLGNVRCSAAAEGDAR